MKFNWNAVVIVVFVIVVAVIATSCQRPLEDGVERSPLFELGDINVYQFTLTDGTRCFVSVDEYNGVHSLDCER